jgi:hypothetical protein
VNRLLDPIDGADHREIAGAKQDIVGVGNGRVTRTIYPPGFRWSTHMKEEVGTDLCRHAHVGFLAQGEVEGEYADGCRFRFAAPQVVVIEPGHDAWVVGNEPAVLIEFDRGPETPSHFGLPSEHRHR